MRYQKVLLSALFITCVFFVGTASAKWAYAFVVYDDNIYVISKERVEPQKIGSKIGKVTKHSGQEGTYSGNFSNHYPKGTQYYEIIGVNVSDAIAVRENNEQYIKATFEGKYEGSKYGLRDYLPYVFSILLLGIAAIFFVRKRLSR